MENLIRKYCSLSLVENDDGEEDLDSLMINVFTNHILEISDYLDWKSLVVFGKQIRKKWPFSVKALDRSTVVSETSLVKDFKKQLAVLLLKYETNVMDICSILSDHNGYLSGSSVLAALQGTLKSNDLDIYTIACNTLALKNRVVEYYDSKPNVLSVVVNQGRDFGGYKVYNIVVQCLIHVHGEPLIKTFKVQVINCQGSFGMFSFDMSIVMNSFGTKNVALQNAFYGYVSYLDGDMPDNEYMYRSNEVLGAHQVVVPVQTISTMLCVSDVDSLRFNVMALNIVQFDALTNLDSIENVCQTIYGLNNTLKSRIAKYKRRGFIDRNDEVRNSIRCILYRLYEHVRMIMNDAETFVVDNITILEIMEFQACVDDEIPLFLANFDAYIASKKKGYKLQWDVVM